MPSENASNRNIPDPPSPRGYRFGREVWALVIALPLATVSHLGLATAIAEFRAEFALSYTNLGLVLAAFGVARLLMDLPAGAIAQRVNPRAFLLSAMLLVVFSSALGLFAPSAWLVGVARFINGIASSVVQAVTLAWLVGAVSAAGRARVMALVEAGYSAVALLVPLLVGSVATFYGWRVAYVFGLAAAVIGAAVIVRGTNAESSARALGQGAARGAENKQRGGLGSLRSGGSLLVTAYLLTFVIFFGRNALTSTLLPVLGGERLGLLPVTLGLALSLLSIVSMFAVLGGGWLADRLGRQSIVLPGMGLLIVSQAGLFFMTGEGAFLAIAALQGLGFLHNVLPGSLVGDALPASARSLGIAFYRLTADIGLLLAPVAMGLALEVGGFDAAIVALLAPTLLITLILAGLQWWTPRRVRPSTAA